MRLPNRDSLETMIKKILLDELAKELGTTRQGLSTQAIEHDAKILEAIRRLRDK